ncbi:phosphatidylglycerol lysyltransferase domain-containing protein [Spirillospora sp. CA-108201]
MDRHGWRPAVPAARADRLTLYRRFGMHVLYSGDEAIIDVAAFSLTSRRMRNVRQAVDRSRNSSRNARHARQGRRGGAHRIAGRQPDAADVAESESVPAVGEKSRRLWQRRMKGARCRREDGPAVRPAPRAPRSASAIASTAVSEEDQRQAERRRRPRANHSAPPFLSLYVRESSVDHHSRRIAG